MGSSSISAAGADPDPANNDAMIGWVKNTWQATHPHGAGGVYLNFIGVEEQKRIRASYRGNYDRLRAVKRAWDSSNLFRVNHNIPPS